MQDNLSAVTYTSEAVASQLGQVNQAGAGVRRSGNEIQFVRGAMHNATLISSHRSSKSNHMSLEYLYELMNELRQGQGAVSRRLQKALCALIDDRVAAH